MKEKTPLLHKFVCFQMPNKRIRASSLFFFFFFEWEITTFSKSMLLQRESFLTMFYTINSSPALACYQVSLYDNNYAHALFNIDIPGARTIAVSRWEFIIPCYMPTSLVQRGIMFWNNLSYSIKSSITLPAFTRKKKRKNLLMLIRRFEVYC